MCKNWENKLAVGTAGETVVIQALIDWKYIAPLYMPIPGDKQIEYGFDVLALSRIPIYEPYQGPVRLEIKTDFVAATTGNIFLEEYSNFEEKKFGWLYTTHADFIVYYIPPKGDLLLFSTDKMSSLNLSNYKQVSAKDDNKTSRGYIVPIIDLAEHYITAHKFETESELVKFEVDGLL